MASNNKSGEKSKRLARPGMTVELVVGDEWRDEKSGVHLMRGFYRLPTKEEWKNKDIAQKGYIRLKREIRPFQKIDKNVSVENLDRVEKGLRMGILKEYDSKKPTVYKERSELKNVYTDAENNIVYEDKVENDINKLLKLPLAKFKESLDDIKTISMLNKIKRAEWDGRNPSARPRKVFVSEIEKKIKNTGGVSDIEETEEEEVEIS